MEDILREDYRDYSKWDFEQNCYIGFTRARWNAKEIGALLVWNVEEVEESDG